MIPTTSPLRHRLVLGSDLSRGAKLVLFALRRYAREKAIAWPGQVRLAADVGASERSVRNYVAELRAAGCIAVERRGQGRTNRYTLGGAAAPIAPLKTGRMRRSRPATVAAEHRARVEKRVSTTAPADVLLEKKAADMAPAAPAAPEHNVEQLPLGDIVARELRANCERVGVAARVAAKLVRDHPAPVVELQLAALPYRNARDRAATLVASIRERWDPPAALQAARDRDELRRAREAAEVAQRAREAMQDAERDRDRAAALQRLAALNVAERRSLEDRARAEVRERTRNLVREDSASFAMMLAAHVHSMLT